MKCDFCKYGTRKQLKIKRTGKMFNVCSKHLRLLWQMENEHKAKYGNDTKEPAKYEEMLEDYRHKNVRNLENNRLNLT